VKKTLSSFKQAVKALQSSDLIIIQDKNSSDRVIATFVGWENEGDEESDYVIGAEGWDDVYIPHDQYTEREGNVLRPHGHCVVLELYKKMP
jgi:hypothetical protein